MTLPLTTPCAHNFCKACLEGAFTGQAFERERKSLGGRTLRSQKNVMKCPSCKLDISEFLRNPEVWNSISLCFCKTLVLVWFVLVFIFKKHRMFFGS